jgi:hypothetical protein
MTRKIHTAAQFPATCLDCWTSDKRCFTIWAKSTAEKVGGLLIPPQDCIASVQRDDDWMDVVVNADQLTRDNVTEAMSGIFGQVVLV